MVVVVFAASEWQCVRCGSTRARRAPSGRLKGCADCSRRIAREQTARLRRAREAELDFEVTPAMRAYLAAFDRYLLAAKTGDTAGARAAETERHEALRALTEDTSSTSEGNREWQALPARTC